MRKSKQAKEREKNEEIYVFHIYESKEKIDWSNDINCYHIRMLSHVYRKHHNDDDDDDDIKLSLSVARSGMKSILHRLLHIFILQ